MCLLLAFAYRNFASHIPPQIPSSTINNTSESVNSSNSTPIFSKQACHANPGAVKK